jgi:hypothetical protein
MHTVASKEPLAISASVTACKAAMAKLLITTGWLNVPTVNGVVSL